VAHEYFDFYRSYNEWSDNDGPPEDFRFWVMAWLYRIQDDPTADAAPAEGLGEPWWFVQIPHAENGTHTVVCLYSIDENRVRCSGITTLPKPVTL
jgi:hypothetical protein